MANNYVDDKRLYTEMVKHINAYREAKEKGTELPRINNYIGKCIQDIAYGLSSKKQFSGYSFVDEMRDDGIEICLRYLHNFDPDKYTKPFAYFTQIIYYAFLNRIKIEQKQSYLKYKLMENSIVMNTLVEMAPDDQSHFHAIISDMDYDKMARFSEKFESTIVKKTNKKKKGVEKFIEDTE